MKFRKFQAHVKNLPAFNLNDVRKFDPDFHRQQLNDWLRRGYIQSLAGGYYLLADQQIDEGYRFMLANKIYEPSYNSRESALAYYLVIPETELGVTSVSSCKTRQFDSQWGVFSYRSIKPALMFGYRVIEREKLVKYKIASLEKAVLDYLYWNTRISSIEDFTELRWNRQELLVLANNLAFEKYLTVRRLSIGQTYPWSTSMLDFAQIKEQYPENLRRFERAILREYLQYKILQAIFDSHQASLLAFLGGTALRIVHGNRRFSEDIVLDNFGLSWTEFEAVIQKVEHFLTLEGFEVEIRKVAKGAYRCYLKFPALLYEQDLSPLPEEKILIQVDTTAPGYMYQPEIVLLNKFDVFTEIRVTPLNILLSQKIYTAVNRKRPKGWDFYDTTFLSSRTKPDLGFLNQKLDVNTAERLRAEVSTRIAGYDFKNLAVDVAPFLMSREDIQRVEKFKKFWNQVALE